MSKDNFIINLNTQIYFSGNKKTLLNAIRILKRDILSVCQMGIKENKIVLISDNKLEDEQYRIEVSEPKIKVSANSDLGFVYGLLRISEEFLCVPKFGF